MNRTRRTLLGLAVTAVIVAPTAAVATGAGSHGNLTEELTHNPTNIRYLSFVHIHGAGTPMSIRGQVVATVHHKHGALAGVHVRLYRRLDGTSNWVYQASRTTTDGAFPQFTFQVTVKQNAHYRVVYGGSALWQPSDGTTWAKAFRSFNGHVKDAPTAATLAGNVSPFYTHKKISLQKRSCASCSYVTVKTVFTKPGGGYSFSLPAPDHGRWWWRVAVPGTVSFLPSYGATFTTELTK